MYIKVKMLVMNQPVHSEPIRGGWQGGRIMPAWTACVVSGSSGVLHFFLGFVYFP